jgi:hypothetical protein
MLVMCTALSDKLSTANGRGCSMDARQATITLAMLMARDAVKRKLRAEGRVKLSQVSAAQLSTMARAYLLDHRVELLAQAEASPIVQNLRVSHGRRRVDRTTNSVCRIHVQKPYNCETAGKRSDFIFRNFYRGI